MHEAQCRVPRFEIKHSQPIRGSRSCGRADTHERLPPLHGVVGLDKAEADDDFLDFGVGASVTIPALMSRPVGFKPSSPDRIDALNFCIYKGNLDIQEIWLATSPRPACAVPNLPAQNRNYNEWPDGTSPMAFVLRRFLACPKPAPGGAGREIGGKVS